MIEMLWNVAEVIVVVVLVLIGICVALGLIVVATAMTRLAVEYVYRIITKENRNA